MVKVLRWLIFGAGVSLLPLSIAYVDLRMRSQQINLEKIIGNGELLVIVWVLSASAIGELSGSADAKRVAKIVFGGLTFIVILVSALFFSSITEAHVNKTDVDEQFIVIVSIALYIVSLIPCSVCIYCADA